MTDQHVVLGNDLASAARDEQPTPTPHPAPYSPVGVAQTLANGEALRCDMAAEDTSSARVCVECFSRVDAEVIAAGALLGGNARLETGDCATCPRLTKDLVTVLSQARDLARGTDESVTLTVVNVTAHDCADDDWRPASTAVRPRRSWRWKRSASTRPAPAVSRRDLFLMGFGRKTTTDEASNRSEPATALSHVRLGASARDVYLASHSLPLLPSVVVTDQCTACDVCAQLCLAQALELNQGNLIFDPARCLECGECVATCPEKVLELRPRERGRDPRVIAEVPVEECTTCGRPLGPHEQGVCHNCSTLNSLTSGIWDVLEEK